MDVLVMVEVKVVVGTGVAVGVGVGATGERECNNTREGVLRCALGGGGFCEM